MNLSNKIKISVMFLKRTIQKSSHNISGGGNGFIGTRLTRMVAKGKNDVTIISRTPGPGVITWVIFISILECLFWIYVMYQ